MVRLRGTESSGKNVPRRGGAEFVDYVLKLAAAVANLRSSQALCAPIDLKD